MTTFLARAQFERRDGRAAKGRVIFRPIVERALDGSVIALGDPVVAKLDAEGKIAQPLVVDLNGYAFDALVNGAPEWSGEIPGNADIDLLAVPTSPPSPPGPFRELEDTIYTVVNSDGGCTLAMVADEDIVVGFDGLLELNATGNIIAAGQGQIRAAELGACTLRYARSDLVDAFSTAVPGSAFTFVQGPRNEVWLIGDMEIPE